MKQPSLQELLEKITNMTPQAEQKMTALKAAFLKATKKEDDA